MYNSSSIYAICKIYTYLEARHSKLSIGIQKLKICIMIKTSELITIQSCDGTLTNT